MAHGDSVPWTHAKANSFMKVESTPANDLPNGYRITRKNGAFDLTKNGKLLRVSNDRDALVEYAKNDAS